MDLTDAAASQIDGKLTSNEGGQTCEDVKSHDETDTALLGESASFKNHTHLTSVLLALAETQ